MIYHILWILYIYSFLGWLAETINGAVRRKKFVNRGFLNGPVCILYGLAAVISTIGLADLQENLFFLFLGGMIYATVLEWIAGHLLERIGHGRWWDYSAIRWNLDGYICLPYSLLWGLLTCVMVKWANPSIMMLLDKLPHVAGEIILWIISVIALIDTAGSLAIVTHYDRIRPVTDANNKIDELTVRFGRFIVNRFAERTRKAHPTIERQRVKERKAEHFAEGCGFYKLALLFLIGGVAGDLIEMVFCRFTAGYWMSRSGVVWGPFSIVWGLAFALASALLYRYRERSDGFLFLAGTLLGGAYEYICSVATEVVFGTVFWDYSHVPFNLAGRINLLFCFFWGIAAVIWIKCAYPLLSGMIERIPQRAGKIVTWGLIGFMSVNMIVSALAFGRYVERQDGMAAANAVAEYMDEHYDDTRMQRIFPNAKRVERPKPPQKGQ